MLYGHTPTHLTIREFAELWNQTYELALTASI